MSDELHGFKFFLFFRHSFHRIRFIFFPTPSDGVYPATSVTSKSIHDIDTPHQWSHRDQNTQGFRKSIKLFFKIEEKMERKKRRNSACRSHNVYEQSQPRLGKEKEVALKPTTKPTAQNSAVEIFKLCKLCAIKRQICVRTNSSLAFDGVQLENICAKERRLLICSDLSASIAKLERQKAKLKKHVESLTCTCLEALNIPQSPSPQSRWSNRPLCLHTWDLSAPTSPPRFRTQCTWQTSSLQQKPNRKINVSSIKHVFRRKSNEIFAILGVTYRFLCRGQKGDRQTDLLLRWLDSSTAYIICEKMCDPSKWNCTTKSEKAHSCLSFLGLEFLGCQNIYLFLKVFPSEGSFLTSSFMYGRIWKENEPKCISFGTMPITQREEPHVQTAAKAVKKINNKAHHQTGPSF